MKFCSWQHFDLKSFCHAKTTFEFENLKIKDIGWKNFLNKNCRSPKVMKHGSWQLFDLKTSCHAKLRLNFKILKFKFYKRPRMEKQPK